MVYGLDGRCSSPVKGKKIILSSTVSRLFLGPTNVSEERTASSFRVKEKPVRVITRRHIPEEIFVNSDRCENLKSDRCGKRFSGVLFIFLVLR
jgi:hypothetical protein